MHVVAGMARNRYTPTLVGVFELAVAPFRGHVAPSIGFDEFDEIPDLHLSTDSMLFVAATDIAGGATEAAPLY